MSQKNKLILIFTLALILAAGVSYSIYTQNTALTSIQAPPPQPQEIVPPPKPKTGLIREIFIQYPNGYVAQRNGEICKLIQGSSDEPPLTISKAQDLWQCQTLHFTFKTNNVKVTLESLNEQWAIDRQMEKDGNSHFFEIEDWTYVYANLLTNQEVLDLQSYAKSKGPLAEIAGRVLHYRTNKK